MNTTQILDLLQGVTRNGDGWKARCPAHDDQTPSLSIKEGDDGRTLLKCHAGCTTEAICAKLNLTLADLFPPKETRNGGSKRIVASYNYHDRDGKLAFQVVRYEPKDFRQRKPDTTAPDGWTWNTRGVEKVLFRLPEILRDAENGKFIFICEGEKDALAMAERGFSATCNPGGAGKWQDSYTETLRGADVVIIPDKDAPGRAHAALVAGKLRGIAKSVRVIELPDVNGKSIKDAFDFFAAGGDTGQIFELVDKTPEWTPANVPDVDTKTKSAKPMIEFFMPSELSAFTPPEGFNLVGNYHIQKAAPFVIGGAPGVGKSRAAVALAVVGSTGGDWFGFKVHRQFKTMIVQAENGRVRLKNEFEDMDCAALDEFVRVCSPPPFGFAFDKLAFCDQLRREIEKFQPDVFILDPFNRLARDDKARDYAEAFEDLLSVLPTGDDAPALGIVAHTRKPRTDERANGRALLNLLAGSYVIGSVPRTVFVMQAASDDTEDKRIVWTCCKNNDGELGARSAWERGNGLFVPAVDFDWKTFDGDGEKRRTVSLDDLDALFEGGKKQLARNNAVEQLMEQTGLGKTACYQALKRNGKFAQNLFEQDGLLNFKS
jgi:AAA domain